MLLVIFIFKILPSQKTAKYKFKQEYFTKLILLDICKSIKTITLKINYLTFSKIHPVFMLFIWSEIALFQMRKRGNSLYS